jgi:SAM-dependent methyltransferase
MDKAFYAEYYEIEDRHWWFAGRRQILLRVLERELGERARDLDILDFGCGTGTMLGHLARFGDPGGVDIDESAIDFCHQRGVDAARRIEPGPLPYADASFDLVTALDVIEHIEDDRATLAELDRVLRPGGHLLVAVPAMPFLWGPQDEISQHFRRYTAPVLRERLREAGFAVHRLSYFNTILFPGIAAVRLLRRDRGNGEVKSDFTLTDRESLMNRVLTRVFAAEAPFVSRRDLPFGVSLLAFAEKPAG